MSERDELKKNISAIIKYNRDPAGLISDLILADRKAVVEKVVVPLRDHMLDYPVDTSRFPVGRVNYSASKLAVMETLRLADEVCK